MIFHQNQHRRFGLSFRNGSPPAICVAIWKPCIHRLSELSAQHQMVPHYLKKWRLKSFQPDLRIGFGFDGACITTAEEDGYLILQAPILPKMQEAISLSLELLFNALNLYPHLSVKMFNEEAEADHTRMQFMELQCSLASDRYFHAAPLSGIAAPVFVEWVERTAATLPRLPTVEEAMWHTWNAMSRLPKGRRQKSPDPYSGFTARLGENGSFFVNCIGDACDVSTIDWWGREPGFGHTLGCHNLDVPIQQLSLIAGLAVMHAMADKEIYNEPPS